MTSGSVYMTFRTFFRYVFYVCASLTVFFTACLVLLYVDAYKDPRWRIFDFHSRQASEGEIYNVAEVPAVKSVDLVGYRKLRFTFTPPVKADGWKILRAEDRSIVHEGTRPEIQFTDESSNGTYLFIPEGVALLKEIAVTISFYPHEKYEAKGLAWPDNYYSPYSSVPFSITRPRSLAEWTGFKENDPELTDARDIIEGHYDPQASVVRRSEQIFAFVMNEIAATGGTPTDQLQDASPLETYRMLTSRESPGWCENRALVYYLFANAAGVPTRLVDLAGKFGPLKLTGHYFCESFDPVQAKWYFVDPMSSVAHITDPSGRLLDTLELKKLFDLAYIRYERALTYSLDTQSLADTGIETFMRSNRGYFTGDIVMAYKFGYPRNAGFKAVHHFLFCPTLLYAPFKIPSLYTIKIACLAGFVIGSVCALVAGIIAALTRYPRSSA